MSFDLNLLPILFAIFETRNVSDAAQRLGMSQPGLSTALKRARVALGDPLFLKTSHGMEPTARTRELIEPVRHILGLVENKITVLPQFDPVEADTQFRLAMSDVGEAIYLPPLMRHLTRVAPNVSVRSMPYHYRELELMLERGEIDLAIGYYPVLKGADMVEQLIVKTSFVCIGGIHAQPDRSDLSLHEFSQVPQVVVDFDGSNYEVFERHLKRQKIRSNIVLHLGHFMSLPSVIAGTDLVAMVPSALGDFLVNQGLAKMFRLPFDVPSFELKMHWHRTSHHDAKHVWIRKTLLNELRKVVAMEAIRLAPEPSHESSRKRIDG